MGSPPTPYNSTVRLIVYPTGLGTSQFQRLFMLKGEFFCNVSSRYHFFTHGSYIDVKSLVESIYGSEKPKRRLLSELEAKNGKLFSVFKSSVWVDCENTGCNKTLQKRFYSSQYVTQHCTSRTLGRYKDGKSRYGRYGRFRHQKSIWESSSQNRGFQQKSIWKLSSQNRGFQ